jgi:hypothetical protein
MSAFTNSSSGTFLLRIYPTVFQFLHPNSKWNGIFDILKEAMHETPVPHWQTSCLCIRANQLSLYQNYKFLHFREKFLHSHFLDFCETFLHSWRSGSFRIVPPALTMPCSINRAHESEN